MQLSNASSRVGKAMNRCKWNPKARQPSIRALRSSDKGLMISDTFMAWAFPTVASGLFTSRYRKESIESWKALAPCTKDNQSSEPKMTGVGHSGDYLKLITLLSGKCSISEKEHLRWIFLLSLHENTGQTKVRIRGASVTHIRTTIKYKPTLAPMAVGCSNPQWLQAGCLHRVS